MTLRRALLAAAFLWCAPAHGEEQHPGHAAPARIKTAAPPANASPAPAGQVPCRAGGELCYTPDETERVGERLAAEFPNLKHVGKVFAARKPDVEVSVSDVEQLRQFFAAEQRALLALRERVSPREQAIIDRGSAEQIIAVFKAQSPEVRRSMKSDIQAMRRGMEGLMTRGDFNSFHDSLSKIDDLANKIMSRIGHGPIMTGPGWQASEPSNPQAHNYGAQQSLEAGDWKSAAAQAQAALALDARNAEALSILAAAQYEMKNMADAKTAAGQALAIDPNDARAAAVDRLAHDVRLGAAPKAELGESDGAAGLEQAWGAPRALEAGQAFETDALARQAEKALSMGDYAAAQRYAGQALSIDPRYAYAHGLKAHARLKEGNSEQALKDAMTGLSLDPKEALSQKARAQALLRMGKYKEGLLAALAAQSGDPASGLAHYLEAAARDGLGDRAGALEALRRAAELDPRYAEVYKAGLQLAQDGDMSLLFADARPAGAAAQALARGGRGGRFAAVALAALLGGGLLAFGLIKFAAIPMARALATTLRRQEPAAASAEAASVFAGNFRTVRQIGAGGMGLVFEARDVSLDRRVAVKKMRDELRLDRRERERFVTEAKLVAALRHPNIVEIFAIVDRGDELALVFEYVQGSTLHELIGRRGRFSFAEALPLFRGVAAALEFAHARGVVHRDLKPSNIMVTDEGLPKVMDFGVARAAKDAMTRHSMTNTIVGTPPYMAPEQEQGVVRKESDVYALAVCLFEMLCGGLPFKGGSAGGMLLAKMNKAFSPASSLAPGLPDGIDAVFEKAFEPDPELRHRSVAELRAALEALRVPA